MGGNSESAKKGVATNLKKYGPDYYSYLGSKGGSVKVKKGLAALSPERRKEIAAMGGKAKAGKG